MAINIRNSYIEKNIETIRKNIMKELGISKLSRPQTINILIDDYKSNKGRFI